MRLDHITPNEFEQVLVETAYYRKQRKDECKDRFLHRAKSALPAFQWVMQEVEHHKQVLQAMQEQLIAETLQISDTRQKR